ncbi:MAG: PKD domain-containing protein [Candidatus Pacebacteria bacterium]|nr:PKD domain-containing protein [Candidatus Paceibacterota bacterium]
MSTNNANVSWSIAGAGSGSGTTGLYSNLAFATYTISITNPTNYTCSPDAWSKAIDSGAPDKTFTVTCVFSALPTAFLTNFDTASGYTRLTSMGASSNGTLTGSASAPAGTITNILIVIREWNSSTDCSSSNRDWNGSSWQAACTGGGYTTASFTPSQNPSWTSTNTPGAADLIVGKTYRVYVNAYDSLGNQSGWAYYKSIVYALPANNALYVSQSVPTTIVAGQTATATVTITNNGTTTWTAGTNYKLGSQNPADNTTWGLLRVPVGSSISPGSTTTFSFTITAPSTPGTYNFQWRMVQELIEWFGNTTPNVAITVTATNPVVSSVQAGVQDYCSHSDQRSISWSYSDPLAKAQASYTVQIGRDPLFADYDFSYSGIGSSTNYTQTGLSYNTTYYARVKAVNSSGVESAWASSAAWTTPNHVYPTADFTFAPSKPEIGATTTFTNTSTCSPSCQTWSWNFGDNSGTSNSQSPTHAFSAASTYSVQLTATDADGYSCTTTKSVPVQQRIPGWKEVLPR